jgi:formamidopyrimidine-DNA glycosylase
MPELPEVEALGAFLRERAVGHQAAQIQQLAINVLKTFDPPPSALVGRTLVETTRHGKFLDLIFFDAAGEPLHLFTHLARAGWLRWKESQPKAPARPGRGPLALRLTFEDGSGFDLTEAGTQKRLAVYVVTDPALVPGVARLGLDPLSPDLTPEKLGEVLAAAGRSRVKGVLTDQTVLAGVGNAYSDEALWVAKLSPFKPASSLMPDEVERLYQGLTGVLQTAVEASAGMSAGDLKAEKKAGLSVHARTGQPCPRCGDTIREVSFSDKSLQYCPTCQTGGRTLADRRMSRLLK